MSEATETDVAEAAAPADAEDGQAGAAAQPEPFERKLDARLILSIVAAGIMGFAGAVVETAMNITFPTLMEEFGVSTATVQWITTGYLLVLAIIMPISAFLKRRFKMRTLFIWAASLFFVGTLMCATAPVFGLVIAGRLVQGVGTGISMPLMYNIVIDQAPRDKMGMMMGLVMFVGLIAPAVGPSLGGLIVTYLGWRMIFVVLMPFILLALVLGALTIRQATPTERVGFNVPQFIVLGLSFTCLVFATSSASTAGWLSAQVLGLLAGFVVLLVLFYFMASRSDDPLIHVEVLKSAPFTFGLLYIPLFASTILGLGYLIPNYAELVFDYSEFAAGCLLLPGVLVGAVLSPLAGRILDRYGAKRPILTGAICQFVAMALFAAVGCRAGVLWMAAIYVLTTIGQGLSGSNTMTNSLSYLPDNLKADGNACYNTLQQLGGAVGTAVATSIVNAAQAGAADIAVATSVGVQQAFWVLLGVSGAALACSIAVFVAAARQQKSAK